MRVDYRKALAYSLITCIIILVVTMIAALVHQGKEVRIMEDECAAEWGTMYSATNGQRLCIKNGEVLWIKRVRSMFREEGQIWTNFKYRQQGGANASRE